MSRLWYGKMRGSLAYVIPSPSQKNLPTLETASDHYPDGLFDTVVEVILQMAGKRLPKWIVNKDVKPKWKLK